ncbi:methyltransferase domain-containing protein [Actinomadura sp. LD22]|uniref:Methyltransferase domain-containing protein n=1 Tax=Actinomadura physcomitrii TaxID=2650748 RepID=A0A6I4M604_9ACTN|nr:methyltransferase domain-containing protein [Actinomadura physcomitrii]MVZ99576.1 methyltransferase domain-containing protein [Actinomadura physcomitrii]
MATEEGGATADGPRAGTGPGEIADDGSAVEFYAALPPDVASAALVHTTIPAGTPILELGAGAGRVTRPLLEFGHPVTAVDASAAMLARIQGARTVRSAIQDLDLPDRFGCVLLMSYLVNYGDRDALLAACRRHVRPDGVVVIQRDTDALWRDDAPREWTRDGVRYRKAHVEHPEPGTVVATLEYRIGEHRWTHTFTTRRLGDEDLPAVLEAAGLRLGHFLDDDGAWFTARPR